MPNESAPCLLQEWPAPGVCRLRMNRPHAYNALSRELVDEMRAALVGIEAQGARVAVLAASSPGFCSGADLKQRRTMNDAEKYAHNRAINALADELAGLPMPTIAAINGVAMGGGCELALACDLRVASKDSRIGLTEARIGAMPGAGGTHRLPRLIGAARALEMMFSGEPVTAARAAEIGLVNDSVNADHLEGRVLELAAGFAARSRPTAALLKRTVYDGLDRPLAEGLELERRAIVEVLASDDYKEGLAAFAERRCPRFC
jgi:enoyl-CoA hydratase/carnithine racemase